MPPMQLVNSSQSSSSSSSSSSSHAKFKDSSNISKTSIFTAVECYPSVQQHCQGNNKSIPCSSLYLYMHLFNNLLAGQGLHIPSASHSVTN